MWFDTNYSYLTKSERVYLTPQQKEIALGDALRYCRRHHGDWSHIREAEVDVSLVKDEYILSGTVDLIEGVGNTYEIIDFKSEQKPDVNNPGDYERIDRYRRQLEVYAHIIEERTGIEVSRMHLYYTREELGVPTISFDKHSRAVGRTIEAIDDIVHRIEQKDFRIKERPTRLCKECDLRAYCDAKHWNFRKDG
jgi:DNA helicase-2/ATP-dependent DNA helicase PcrA